MNKNNATLKVVFGGIIFLFSLAFAYFTAHYVEGSDSFDFWLALVAFAVGYLVIGMLVSRIFAVSFGFLFSADILFLHLLLENFGDWPDSLKAYAMFLVVVILYLIAFIRYADPKDMKTNEAPAVMPMKNTP
jgi:hypothetical protein